MDDFGIDSGLLIDNDMNVAGDLSTVGVWTDINNWSNLKGRRAYCKDKGLSGAALRECKKQLRESDKTLSKEEVKELAIQRKSGSGLVSDMLYGEGKGGLDDTMNPDVSGTRSADMPVPTSKPRTGLIIGVSIGAVALISFLVWFFFFRNKTSK